MNQSKETDAVLAFDLLYTTNHIQMLKATLPYAPKHMQPMFAIFIKYMELAYTLSCVNHPLLSSSTASEQELNAESITSLISALEQYLTENERKKMNQIKNMMRNLEQMREMQKIMDFLQPTGSDAENILSNFMPKSDDFSKPSIDQTIAQIFSTLDS